MCASFSVVSQVQRSRVSKLTMVYTSASKVCVYGKVCECFVGTVYVQNVDECVCMFVGQPHNFGVHFSG